MKGLQVFGIIVVVFAAIIGLSMLNSKRDFEWNPTFEYDDDEPFGCKLFDKMVASSMGNRYYVDHHSEWAHNLVKQKYSEPQGWLFLQYKLSLNLNETDHLLSLARRGDCVMVVSGSFGTSLLDSLLLYESADNWLLSIRSLEEEMSHHDASDYIVWADGKHDPFPVAPVMNSVSLVVRSDSLIYKVLAVNRYVSRGEQIKIATPSHKLTSHIAAISIKYGKGEIILVSTPLMFTNYGMLSGRGSQYIFRLLSHFGDKPVRRVQLKTHSTQSEDSLLALLDYIQEQPPLWWAWCITMLLIILFMLTNFRHRQRIIPVVTPPQNHSLEFVRLIGTLYAQQGNHTDLVEKKYRYTAERLRRELHIDITASEDDRQSAAVIAQNTNLKPDEAMEIIQEVRQQLASHVGLSEERMRHYIDQLNRLTSK